MRQYNHHQPPPTTTNHNTMLCRFPFLLSLAFHSLSSTSSPSNSHSPLFFLAPLVLQYFLIFVLDPGLFLFLVFQPQCFLFLELFRFLWNKNGSMIRENRSRVDLALLVRLSYKRGCTKIPSNVLVYLTPFEHGEHHFKSCRISLAHILSLSLVVAIPGSSYECLLALLYELWEVVKF